MQHTHEVKNVTRKGTDSMKKISNKRRRYRRIKQNGYFSVSHYDNAVEAWKAYMCLTKDIECSGGCVGCRYDFNKNMTRKK